VKITSEDSIKVDLGEVKRWFGYDLLPPFFYKPGVLID
jgi:hypothetical protein